MRGTIKQRAKGSWTIIRDVGRDPVTGKRKQKWVAVKGTKAKAQQELRKLLTKIDDGIPVDNTKVTVREYLTGWLQSSEVTLKRPRTTEGYTTIVNRHIIPAIGSKQLQKLGTADVKRMEAGLLDSGLSPNTVHHVHITLSKALKDAMRGDDGLLHRNVCQGVKPPSPGRYEVKVPDAHAIKEILTLAEDTPYGTALRFAAYTGCRRGEVIALRWETVDLEMGVASIVETAQRLRGKGIVFQPTKSAAGKRAVALDPETVDVLRVHRGRQLLHQVELCGAFQDQGLVFPGPLGGPLDPSVLTRNFKKLARKAGYSGIRLHDLRHGHAAGLIKSGAQAVVVQERLGHASPAFTMSVYGHVSPGMQAEAANAFAKLMAEQER